MLRPLIAIDLNSRIGNAKIFNFVKYVLKIFGIADVVFIMDDNSIVEFDNSRIFPISDAESVVSLVDNLKALSEEKANLDLRSVIKVKRELGRSVLIVVSDRKIAQSDELIFNYNGKKIKKIIHNLPYRQYS
ncbi:MAG: hypothetical protein QXR57_00185 [Metallosphaera sp.]|uniref:Uncharacterized protein n=1 Tax=Metallosphaera cuprina (strain Ar-4) TaxID=1006006 RepID=F4G0V4_METCR|nr:hypothetical protein [Metallosphaera cuprina]AEB95913.1 conserved hypothetical protein [Metallosphaera cuprina Ar-4]